MTLAGWLRGVPDSLFWKSGEDHPDYKRLLRMFEGQTGRTPNPSTFQRTVAKEAVKRRLARADRLAG